MLAVRKVCKWCRFCSRTILSLHAIYCEHSLVSFVLNTTNKRSSIECMGICGSCQMTNRSAPNALVSSIWALHSFKPIGNLLCSRSRINNRRRESKIDRIYCWDNHQRGISIVSRWKVRHWKQRLKQRSISTWLTFVSNRLLLLLDFVLVDHATSRFRTHSVELKFYLISRLFRKFSEDWSISTVIFHSRVSWHQPKAFGEIECSTREQPLVDCNRSSSVSLRRWAWTTYTHRQWCLAIQHRWQPLETLDCQPRRPTISPTSSCSCCCGTQVSTEMKVEQVLSSSLAPSGPWDHRFV